VAALGRAAMVGIGFAASFWWFLDREPKSGDGPEGSGGSPPLPPKPPPAPIWLLIAARYCAMLLLVIALALAVLSSTGQGDTLVVHLLQGLGVLGFIFCAVVSVRLWLKQR
jgi:hypothetical protein